MKKWLLSGCLLTLMACGQVPQKQIDSLKQTIADYEENGAGAEMPEEFRALQESFAEVEKSVEAEKEKMFSSYSAVEQKLAQIEKQLDGMAFTIGARSDRFQKMYNKFAREGSLGLLMYASLPKDKARSLPKEIKDDLQRAVQPMPLLRELMKAETYAQKQEILGPQVEKLEKLNEMMRPWLSEQKYDEILKKVEAQMKKTNLSDDSHSGYGLF
ncbi:hypothetical protein [uncultured Alistipes sp.]|uniref:hypothetical protein n=3 Tax=Alistipes TaxID=239759 RepID=UPI00258E6371|nr:hypothetical protein [uncultured Alistipes sp.]